MAGFTPDEGDHLIQNLVYRNSDVDRGTGLQVVLFTNVNPAQTITAATLTQPTGGGYAPIALIDTDFTVTGKIASHVQITFTGGAGGFTGSIQGYAVLTTGTTPRILDIEVDPLGPYTINQNDTYKVTLNSTQD